MRETFIDQTAQTTFLPILSSFLARSVPANSEWVEVVEKVGHGNQLLPNRPKLQYVLEGEEGSIK